MSPSSGPGRPPPRPRRCHASFLLEGRWIVDGKEVAPGGYIFGPGEFPHVTVDAPEGCLVCASVLPSSTMRTQPTPTECIIDPSDVEWQDGAAESNLPVGVYHKVYNIDLVTEPQGHVSSGSSPATWSPPPTSTNNTYNTVLKIRSLDH